MANINIKIQETDNPSKRIYLFILAPISWPTSKLHEYFQVCLTVELNNSINY